MTDHRQDETHSLSAPQQAIEQLTERVAMLEADRDRLDRVARERSRALGALRQENEALREASKIPTPDASQDNGEAVALPADDALAALTQERDLLREALAHQDRELARLRLRPARDNGESQKLHTTVAKLQDQLADMRASTSWRITAPLRWLTLRIRHRQS